MFSIIIVMTFIISAIAFKSIPVKRVIKNIEWTYELPDWTERIFKENRSSKENYSRKFKINESNFKVSIKDKK